LLLDDRPAEDKIIADGYGVVRFDAMYDDFVIVGPIFDPAGTLGLNDTSKAFAQIAATGALSAIRGDDSSTDRLELRLWRSAGAEPDKQAAWYRDVAQGLEES
jgi:tungstate transport system substrate-binding protein